MSDRQWEKEFGSLTLDEDITWSKEELSNADERCGQLSLDFCLRLGRRNWLCVVPVHRGKHQWGKITTWKTLNAC